MGRNARVRAAKKAGDKPGPAIRSAKETKAVKRLRKLAPYINTLAQFEEMVAKSSNQRLFRQLLEPMLRPNLPCCAAGYLHGKYGVKASDVVNPHAEHCPTRKAVMLTDSATGEVSRVRLSSVTDVLEKARGGVTLT